MNGNGRYAKGQSLLSRAPNEPGDEIVGEYTRTQLLKMDQKFCIALERAFARRLELRTSASKEQRPGAGDLDRLSLAS